MLFLLFSFNYATIFHFFTVHFVTEAFNARGFEFFFSIVVGQVKVKIFKRIRRFRCRARAMYNFWLIFEFISNDS